MPRGAPRSGSTGRIAASEAGLGRQVWAGSVTLRVDPTAYCCTAGNARYEPIVLKNSTQRNLVQNIGTLSLQIGHHETMFAKAGYRGKKFPEFDRSGSDTEFFNTISPVRTTAFGTKTDRKAPFVREKEGTPWIIQTAERHDGTVRRNHLEWGRADL